MFKRKHVISRTVVSFHFTFKNSIDKGIRDFRVEERNGDYDCAGVLLIYQHPEPHREEIQIKGPITEDIRIEVHEISDHRVFYLLRENKRS